MQKLLAIAMAALFTASFGAVAADKADAKKDDKKAEAKKDDKKK